MGDDDHGGARFAAGALQQAKDLFAGLVVERAGRLVAQQQFRVFRKRAGNGHTLLFAAGKLRGEVVESVAQADLFQNLARVLRLFAKLGGKLHIFQRRQVRHKIIELENKTDVVAAVIDQFLFGKPVDQTPGNADLAVVAGVHAAEHVQYGGFSGAAGADDQTELAFFHAEGHAVHGGDDDLAGEIAFIYGIKFNKAQEEHSFPAFQHKEAVLVLPKKRVAKNNQFIIS